MVPAHGTAYERICRGPVTAKPHFWNFRKLQFPATGFQAGFLGIRHLQDWLPGMVTKVVNTETKVF